MTLYFKQEHFKTSIPVAMTAMLVMYTLNNSISSKLPQTSNFKFIDVWIIYGLSLHFLILVLLVLIEHPPGQRKVIFLDDSKAERKRRRQRSLSAQKVTRIFARNVLPVLELFFIISYFTCAWVIYNTDHN